MSTHNEFMGCLFSSLAEVIERSEGERQHSSTYAESSRRFLTTTAFNAREYDRDLAEQLAAEYSLGLMMGIKL